MTLNYLYKISLVNTRMNEQGILLMFAVAALIVLTWFVCYKSPFSKWLVPFMAVISLLLYLTLMTVPVWENLL